MTLDAELDIERIRAETPGIPHTNHLLASGSALMPQPVIDAVIGHLQLEAEVGGYEAAADRRAELDATYDSVARLIGAQSHEIALVENATAAWCHAFYSLPLSAGDRVLTCEAEYGANYVAFLQRAKRDGIVIDVVPSTETGEMDVEALRSMIDERVALIAATWVPTNGGLVNPAAAIGAVAAEHGITYLLDGCQAVGQMPVDVAALGCHYFSATGRKFLRGPRGTGFLYVQEDHIERHEPAMIDHFAAEWTATNEYTLRTDARRFENWENAYALRVGLKAAADYALDLGLEAIQNRSWSLARRLRSNLHSIAGAEVRDIGTEQCAIVSFTVEGLDPRPTVAALRERGITIGASSPASTRLDAEARRLPTLMRAAPHCYNTEAEIDALTSALASLAPG